MRQPTVVVVVFGDLGRDPRVHRQIKALRERYRVVGVGFAPSRFDDVEFVPIERRAKSLPRKVFSAIQLLSPRFEDFYWQHQNVRELMAKLDTLDADLIVAHDIDTLPAVVRCARGARVLYDAHDYAPRQFEDRLYFRLFLQRYTTHLSNTYIPYVDGMVTVCESLADAFERDTGVRPVVITNAPDYVELEPKFRSDGDRIRLIHHGAAIRSRRLENMIRAMDYLDDRFELDLMLVENSPGYLDSLRRMADRRRNVKFRPPVPMPEIPQVLNEYDVGVFLLEPVNFNYRFALPNKLFEFIQARLAVAVSPSPEMARLVRDAGCGVVADGFTPKQFAACLRSLDHAAVNEFKQRSDAVARDLSSEKNNIRFMQLVDDLMNARPA